MNTHTNEDESVVDLRNQLQTKTRDLGTSLKLKVDPPD